MSFWRNYDEALEKDGAIKKSNRWYLGKYAGRAPPSHLLEEEENQRKSEDSDRLSSEGRKSDEEAATTTAPTTTNADESPSLKRKPSDNESVQSDDTKDEKFFIRVVRSIRQKFMARKLIGNIYIYRAVGFFTTAMQCQITETDYFSTPIGSLHSIDAMDDVTGGYKRAVTMTDSILDSLERRAMKWDGVDYNAEVTISRGAKFTIGGPFIGIIGYTLSMEISATVQSLIDSRKRYLAHREQDRGSMSSLGSLTRGFSLSFYNNNSKPEQVENKNDQLQQSPPSDNSNAIIADPQKTTSPDRSIIIGEYSTSDEVNAPQSPSSQHILV